MALVLSLLAGTAFAALFIAQQIGQEEHDSTIASTTQETGSGTADNGEGAMSETDAEPEVELTEEQIAAKRLDGWWQGLSARAASSGYTFFHNGMWTAYDSSGQPTGNTGTVSMTRYDNGFGDGINVSFSAGYFVKSSQSTDGYGYFLTDDSPDTLNNTNENGTFYSGTNSLVRVEAPSWGAAIEAQAAEADASGSSESNGSGESAASQAQDEAAARAAAEAAGKQVYRGTVSSPSEFDYGSNAANIGYILNFGGKVNVTGASSDPVSKGQQKSFSGDGLILESANFDAASYLGKQIEVAVSWEDVTMPTGTSSPTRVDIRAANIELIAVL